MEKNFKVNQALSENYPNTNYPNTSGISTTVTYLSNYFFYSRTVSSWILSRAQVLDPSANDIIDPILVEIGVTRSQYREVQQNDPACFYLPEVDENKPVIFRGQCENITGMPNFSIEQVRNAIPVLSIELRNFL